MGAEIMVDEYYERYKRRSHDDLYRQLQAGSPDRVERVVDVWHRVEQTLAAFVTNLRADLVALQPGWSGPGGREYQVRMGLIADYAQTLIDEAVAIRTGLGLMAETLAEAQRQAEPSPDAGGEWAYTGLLDASIGHNLTGAEQSRSYERMVVLVAGLSAAYDLADNRNWPTNVADAPKEMPGQVTPTEPIATDDPYAHRDVRPGLASAVALTAPPPGPITAVLSSPSGPATTLAGAGLAGAPVAAHLIAHASPTGGDSDGSRPIAGGVPMAGGGFPAAVRADGVVHGDSGLRDEAIAWAAGDDVTWSPHDIPPPPIIGDPAALD